MPLSRDEKILRRTIIVFLILMGIVIFVKVYGG